MTVEEAKGLRVDAKLMVVNYIGQWVPAHFARVEKDRICVWSGGATAFTAQHMHSVTPFREEDVRLATEEDISNWRARSVDASW